MHGDPRPEPTECVAAFSQHPDAAAAVGEVVGTVLDRLDTHPDLVIVLAAGPLADRFQPMVEAIRSLLAPETLIGATASAVFGGAGDIDGDRGLVLLAIRGAHLAPVRLRIDEAGELLGPPPGIAPGSAMLVFGERTFPVDRLADDLHAINPDVTLVGSLAAGRSADAAVTLAEQDRFHSDGAVGVLIPPPLVQVFGFEVRLWDQDDPLPEPPVNPVRGTGALLLVDRNVEVIHGGSLDLEVLIDRFTGALAGMVGRAFRAGAQTREIDAGNRVVALVLG